MIERTIQWKCEHRECEETYVQARVDGQTYATWDLGIRNPSGLPWNWSWIRDRLVCSKHTITVDEITYGENVRL